MCTKSSSVSPMDDGHNLLQFLQLCTKGHNLNCQRRPLRPAAFSVACGGGCRGWCRRPARTEATVRCKDPSGDGYRPRRRAGGGDGCRPRRRVGGGGRCRPLQRWRLARADDGGGTCCLLVFGEQAWCFYPANEGEWGGGGGRFAKTTTCTRWLWGD
jgi:hypothetical protein